MGVRTFALPNWEGSNPSQAWYEGYHEVGNSAQSISSSGGGLGSLIGSIGGALPLIGGLFSAFGASRQNRENRKMAREQMQFQKMMSDTAYNRAAKDMANAGLNRVLALGSPASSPGGAQARMENVIQPAIATAMQLQRQAAEIKNIESTTRNTEASTRKTQVETANLGLQPGKIAADIDLAKAQTALANQNKDKALAEIKKLGVDTAHASMIYEMFQSTPGLLEAQYSRPVLDWLKTFGTGAATVAGLIALRRLPIPKAMQNTIRDKLRRMKGFTN